MKWYINDIIINIVDFMLMLLYLYVNVIYVNVIISYSMPTGVFNLSGLLANSYGFAVLKFMPMLLMIHWI